jgi:hypothetical protein
MKMKAFIFFAMIWVGPFGQQALATLSVWKESDAAYLPGSQRVRR